MADISKPEELLLLEYEQQYLQYRHLDNLREKYVAFYIAFVTAIFILSVTNQHLDSLNLLILLLLVIGIFILKISISMRIVQRLTANHLMEIRKELLRLAKLLPLYKYDSNNYQIGYSFLKATYLPSEEWHWKERFKESAIQLIVLLIIVNSYIASYFVRFVDFSLMKNILSYKCILTFVVLLILQMGYFYIRFNSEFSNEKQDDRESKILKFLNKQCK